jgi:hypothetical protein
VNLKHWVKTDYHLTFLEGILLFCFGDPYCPFSSLFIPQNNQMVGKLWDVVCIWTCVEDVQIKSMSPTEFGPEIVTNECFVSTLVHTDIQLKVIEYFKQKIDYFKGKKRKVWIARMSRSSFKEFSPRRALFAFAETNL